MFLNRKQNFIHKILKDAIPHEKWAAKFKSFEVMQTIGKGLKLCFTEKQQSSIYEAKL